MHKGHQHVCMKQYVLSVYLRLAGLEHLSLHLSYHHLIPVPQHGVDPVLRGSVA